MPSKLTSFLAAIMFASYLLLFFTTTNTSSSAELLETAVAEEILRATQRLSVERNVAADPMIADNNSNRSLVIIMGSLRGGEQTWKTLYENVLDPNSADLALIVGKPTKDDQYVNSTLYARSKYSWFFPEYDDWADAVDLINGPGWRETHLPKMKRLRRTGLFGGFQGYTGSGIIIFMIRWFLSRHLQESDVLQKYDTFVITRADHYYLCPHQFADLDISNGTVWTPEGESYGGVTDRHVVVSKKDILQILDVLPSFLSKPFEDTIPDGKRGSNTNPERMLKRAWIRNGLKLKTFPRVMATCATKTDTTRWRVAAKRKNNKVEGEPTLFKKYRKEWVLSKEVCARRGEMVERNETKISTEVS